MRQERLKIPPPAAGRYGAFIKGRERLFFSSREVDWTPDNEIPIQEIRLSNGIPLYFYLSTGTEDPLAFTLEFPVGDYDDISSHLLEHMMVHPRGFPNFEEVVDGTNEFYYNGRTGRSTTELQLLVYPERLSTALASYPGVFNDLSALLFGMAVNPDITGRNVTKQAGLIQDEIAQRRMNIYPKAVDYILPLISLGRAFTRPNPIEETSFTVGELRKRHKARPHKGMRIFLAGNPGTREVGKLISAFDGTFGQIEGASDRPKTARKAPEKYFPYGDKVHIVPARDTRVHLFGIMIVSQITPNPPELARLGGLRDLLVASQSSAARKQGLSYDAFEPEIIYQQAGLSLSCISATTQRPEEIYDFFKDQLSELLQGQKGSSIEGHFRAGRVSAINSLFGQPNLQRIFHSSRYGLPITQNGSALYSLLKNVRFEDVVLYGRQCFEQQRVAYFHSGGGPTLPGFTRIEESELERNWLAQPSI